MLDDLKYIAQKDPQDALGVAVEQPKQLLYSNFEFKPFDIKGVRNIVVAGMGGSPFPGLICKTWFSDELKLPFEIIRDYNLPEYVNKETLVIASSYSGNTEETLSALAQAKTKGAKIIILAAGGKLADIAKAENYPFLEVPNGQNLLQRLAGCLKLTDGLF